MAGDDDDEVTRKERMEPLAQETTRDVDVDDVLGLSEPTDAGTQVSGIPAMKLDEDLGPRQADVELDVIEKFFAAQDADCLKWWKDENFDQRVQFSVPRLRLGRPGVNIVACPTCGRLTGDLFTIVEEVEAAVKARKFDKDLTVALMGCAVNGPGEAQGADLGVSLGRGRAHLFKRGKVVGTVPEEEIVETVLQAIETWDEAEEEVEA